MPKFWEKFLEKLLDTIPGVSQIKSIVHLMSGDNKKAEKTQKNFTDKCIGVSQLKSLYQVATGDFKGALKTQEKFFKNVDFLTDYIPLTGLLKTLVTLMVGNKDKAFKNWKRSGVIPNALSSILGTPYCDPKESEENYFYYLGGLKDDLDTSSDEDDKSDSSSNDDDKSDSSSDEDD
ncbi:unnamed protein product [Brachionus calyciflorus]|uniref:Uncharacterized protein n=1 Tax=Brachionus calyciflorus TaxID=104777 RepID=A0A813QRY7_9BILA|nr:unnamed protein product [Brachionus calyciflorus]